MPVCYLPFYADGCCHMCVLTNYVKVIKACLNKRDALVVMATGSGKSLCYQFPTVYEQWKARPGRLFNGSHDSACGTTIVVSPLLSLMADQVMALQEFGIKATFLGSTQTGRGLRASMEIVCFSCKSAGMCHETRFCPNTSAAHMPPTYPLHTCPNTCVRTYMPPRPERDA